MDGTNEDVTVYKWFSLSVILPLIAFTGAGFHINFRSLRFAEFSEHIAMEHEQQK